MAEEIFDALSHPVRRRAIKLLARRPMTFSELMDELGVDSPTLAFHLKKLGGLVEKNERGFYDLTELGRKALRVLEEVEGAALPAAPEERRVEDILISDRLSFKIDRALLEFAKKRGAKIRIRDVAIVEVADDVDPDLLYDVVESISDVGVVKVSDRLRPYVEPKTRDVLSVGGGGLLASALRLGAEALSYLVPLKLRTKKKMQGVYRGEFKHGGALLVEVAGGKVRLSRGPNYVVARCEDPREFEIGDGKISVGACEVEATADGLSTLELDVSGGYVQVKNSASQFKASLSGGAVDADLELEGRRAEVGVSGGVFAGVLKYKPFEGAAELRINVTGGVAEAALRLPPGVGLEPVVNAAAGIVKTPPPKAGERGVVKAAVEAAGGVVQITVKEDTA